jgi:molybdopterin molybdotransferase
MITIGAALDVVLAATRPLGAEDVPLVDALDRVVSATVTSPTDLPPFTNSAMDGYAVRGEDLAGDRPSLQVIAEIPAGSVSAACVGPGQAAKIMTGAPLPAGSDTVVPVELTEPASHEVTVGDSVVIAGPVAPGANVRHRGEDLSSGTTLLAPGRVLGPADLGLLATVGMAAVRVSRRPRVAILATGSELVAVGEPLGQGQIRDANSVVAYGQALRAGGRPQLLGIARDDREDTRRLLAQALEADVVISSGGVSVGEFDLVKVILEEIGVDRRFWGVKVKPGWPLAFGVRGDTLVFAVPGNPVAAMVSFELFIRPALLKLQGRSDVYRPCVDAAAVERIKPTKQRVELPRCRLTCEGGGWTFTRTGPQGSGMLRSMTLADGLALVPAGYSGSEPRATFPVMLLDGTSDERPPFPE